LVLGANYYWIGNMDCIGCNCYSKVCKYQ